MLSQQIIQKLAAKVKVLVALYVEVTEGCITRVIELIDVVIAENIIGKRIT